MLQDLPCHIIENIVSKLECIEDITNLAEIPFFKPFVSSAVLAINLDDDELHPSIFGKYTSSIYKEIPTNTSAFSFVIVKSQLPAINKNIDEFIRELTETVCLPESKFTFVFSIGPWYIPDTRIEELFTKPYNLIISSYDKMISISDIQKVDASFIDVEELCLFQASYVDPPTIRSESITKLILEAMEKVNEGILQKMDLPNLKCLELGDFQYDSHTKLNYLPKTITELKLRPCFTSKADLHIEELSKIEGLSVIPSLEDERVTILGDLSIPTSTLYLSLQDTPFTRAIGVQNITHLETSVKCFPLATFPNLHTLLLHGDSEHIWNQEALSDINFIDAPKLADLRLKDVTVLNTQLNSKLLRHFATNSSLKQIKGIPFETIADLHVCYHDFKDFEYERFQSVQNLSLEACIVDLIHIDRFPKLKNLRMVGGSFKADSSLLGEYENLMSFDEWKEKWASVELSSLEILFATDITVVRELLKLWKSLENLTVDVFCGDDFNSCRTDLNFPTVKNVLTLICFSQQWPNLFRSGLLDSEAPTIDCARCIKCGDQTTLKVSSSTKTLILDRIWRKGPPLIEQKGYVGSPNKLVVSFGSVDCEEITDPNSAVYHYDQYVEDFYCKDIPRFFL